MTTTPSICVTSQDMERLTGLLTTPTAERMSAAAAALDNEIARADVVEPKALPPDVVTMNSKVLFEDRITGQRREITIAYPGDADPETGRISVFSPVGCALLGLRAGDEIDWPLPGGRMLRVRVLEELYQPEAMGDWHL
jgi:regulator of nucleoside diphosphate kinase